MENNAFNIPYIGDDSLAISVLTVDDPNADVVNRLVAALNKKELLEDSMLQLIPACFTDDDIQSGVGGVLHNIKHRNQICRYFTGNLFTNKEPTIMIMAYQYIENIDKEEYGNWQILQLSK